MPDSYGETEKRNQTPNLIQNFKSMKKINELRHKKICFLHNMRKQKHRSAAQ